MFQQPLTRAVGAIDRVRGSVLRRVLSRLQRPSGCQASCFEHAALSGK